MCVWCGVQNCHKVWSKQTKTNKQKNALGVFSSLSRPSGWCKRGPSSLDGGGQSSCVLWGGKGELSGAQNGVWVRRTDKKRVEKQGRDARPASTPKPKKTGAHKVCAPRYKRGGGTSTKSWAGGQGRCGSGCPSDPPPFVSQSSLEIDCFLSGVRARTGRP